MSRHKLIISDLRKMKEEYGLLLEKAWGGLS
jgi:hypothetical protein